MTRDDTITNLVGDVSFTKHKDGTVSLRTTPDNMERLHRAVMITKLHYDGKSEVSTAVFRVLGNKIFTANKVKGIW